MQKAPSLESGLYSSSTAASASHCARFSAEERSCAPSRYMSHVSVDG